MAEQCTCTRRARWRDKRLLTFFLTRDVREQWSVRIWLPWRSEGRENHLCTWRHQTSSPCFSGGRKLDGAHIQVEAALSEELPVSVLLGTDVPELTHLISGTGLSINLVSQEQVMVARTRAKAKQQLEEELIRMEKELLSSAQPNTLVRVNEPAACDNVVPSRSDSEADRAERQSPMKNSKLTKYRRREIRKKAQETEKSWEGGNSEYLNITIKDLKKLQA